MPTQVLPINDLASAGVVLDTPSVSLPPNVFSNVQNVRFRDGAIRKMEGESPAFISDTGIRYIAHWPAPSGGKFVVIAGTGLRIYNDTSPYAEVGTVRTVAAGGTWQHTLFNGGFHIVLNNGNSTPIFIQDETTPLIQNLPNWDSYLSQESVISVEFSRQFADLSLGQALSTNAGSLTGQSLRVTITPRDQNAAIVSTNITSFGGQNAIGDFMATLQPSDMNNTYPFVNFNPAPADGDLVEIAIVNTATITVTAGVIRSYGNLLVAGDLVERDGTDVVRSLTGMIRTSDVAAPGAIPANWNPFRNGVNTADEFLLASTGRVQDMAELQGVLYVYTDTSIHAVQQTGSPVIPFQISPVTDSYGANNTGSVFDVDGKHIVVGSDDVYVFAGHPGSISSIADGRVRFDSFFDNTDIQILRFQKYDELWFWRPSEREMFIWNYRDNTWTRRFQTAPISGTVGSEPVFATATGLYTVDDGFTITDSFVERRRLALTPEFDTENLASVALLVSGNGQLNIEVRSSNAPGEEVDPTTANDKLFSVADEYKQDIRVLGRFLNYRITHIPDMGTDNGFVLSGMQFDIGKGGTR